jgi:hypothetical protein
MKKDSASTDTSIELAYASLAVFADDGTLDMNELKSLLDIALRDGIISDKEKDILRNIFNRVMEPNVTAEAWDRIQLVRKQHGI